MSRSQISPDMLVLLRHQMARKRATAFKAAHPRLRKNPMTGHHPDLLPAEHRYPPDQRPPRGLPEGHTRMFVALDSLSSEQIRELKRKQFTEDEWDRLEDDDREYIEEHDEESQARVDLLADVFIKRWEWDHKIDDREAFNRVEHVFEDEIREKARGDHFHEWIPGGTYKALVRYAEGIELSESDVDGILTTVMSDSNKYEFTTDRHKRSGSRPIAWEVEVEGYLYVDDDDWQEFFDLCTPDEVVRACEKIRRDTERDIDIKPETLATKTYVEEHFETGTTVYALLELDTVVSDVEQMIEREAEGREPVDQFEDDAPVPEDKRIVYKWADGFYALDLLPSDLPEEGKAMGMCVGREDMGYGRAVKNGEIKIISLRRPSGKPLFTIEAEISGRSHDPDTGKYKSVVVDRIEQIKGKANRKPGFDLGKTDAEFKMKQDEVQRALELVKHLKVEPYQVTDLHPALARIGNMAADGDAWAMKMVRMWPSPHAMGLKALATHPGFTENPSACERDGGGCTGFCKPYRQRARRNPSLPKLEIADYDAVYTLREEATAHGNRFGERKVFLSSIVDMGDPQTRRVLLALNRDGMIELARADLVAAMDPKVVAASELVDPRGATYHFLVD